jgi:methionyl-tRNA formyltransferase
MSTLKFKKNTTFALFLMTERGFYVLRKFIEIDKGIVECVVYASDHTLTNDYSDEIVSLCRQNQITVFHKDSVGPHTIQSPINIAVAWRWLLDSKGKTIIILHDSILPRYRGFSPVVNSLINGEKEIGVTALIANQSFDSGPIIIQRAKTISYPIKIQQAFEVIQALMCEIVEELVAKVYQQKEVSLSHQLEEEASYSLWRDWNDFFIDWKESAHKIKRQIDALGSPYNGAQTLLNDQLIKIMDAEVVENIKIEAGSPGKVIWADNKSFTVVCGTNLLLVTQAFYSDSFVSVAPLKTTRIRFSTPFV